MLKNNEGAETQVIACAGILFIPEDAIRVFESPTEILFEYGQKSEAIMQGGFFIAI